MAIIRVKTKPNIHCNYSFKIIAYIYLNFIKTNHFIHNLLIKLNTEIV